MSLFTRLTNAQKLFRGHCLLCIRWYVFWYGRESRSPLHSSWIFRKSLVWTYRTSYKLFGPISNNSERHKWHNRSKVNKEVHSPKAKRNQFLARWKIVLFVCERSTKECLLCWNRSIQRSKSICFYLTFHLRANKQTEFQVNLVLGNIEFRKALMRKWFRTRFIPMFNLSGDFMWLIKVFT